jgi:hypothetical protein
MPTYAQGQIVVEDMVGVYHCIARCVRRALLCGIDPYTGQDYRTRQVTTPIRWSSWKARSQTASGLRERVRWPVGQTDEVMGSSWVSNPWK